MPVGTLLSAFMDVSIAASLIPQPVCLSYLFCVLLVYWFAFWPNPLNKQIDNQSKCTH